MAARGTASNRGVASNRGLAVGRGTASGRLNVSGGGGGGGGSDLSNVSSLPSPGSASATAMYHLDKDNFTYILNNAGTALVPIHLPGWARNGGANDDEWEGANTDPPAGWTWDNQDSTTVDTNNTIKSTLILVKGNAANKISGLYKNVPAAPQKTYYSIFQFGANINSSSGNSAVGMIARNNTSGRILFFYISNAATYTNLSVTRWATSSSPGLTPFDASVAATFFPGVYGVLGMTYDGTSLIFKYAPLYNGAFENLVTVYSETIAAFLNSFDAFGVGVFNNGTITTTFYSDWIRVV